MTWENLRNPFQKLQTRFLLIRLLLIGWCIGFIVFVIEGFTDLKLEGEIFNLIVYTALFGTLCLWTLADFKQLDMNLKYIIGKKPKNDQWLPMMGLVILMLVFSLSAYLVSFYLVSLIAPNFIQDLMREIASESSTNNPSLLENLFISFVYVVVAPITEEFIFRGIILQRWAVKWGIRWALVASSLVFGLAHANVLGLSIFGFVMGVLYIKTRSLFVPIVCHGLNNLLAVGAEMLPSDSVNNPDVKSLEYLQSNFGIGMLLMLISLPLLLRFLWRNWPGKDTQIPYLINRFS